MEAQANDTRSRIEETIADTTREQSLISDAEAAHARLAEEQSGIEAAREGEEQNRAKAQEDLSTAGEAVQAHENELSGLTQRVADSEARRGSLERRREELTQRQTRLTGRLEELRSEHARLEADAPEAEAMAHAEADMTRTQSAVEDARAMLEAAEESYKAA